MAFRNVFMNGVGQEMDSVRSGKFKEYTSTQSGDLHRIVATTTRFLPEVYLVDFFPPKAGILHRQ